MGRKRSDQPEIRVVSVTFEEDSPEGQQRLMEGYQIIFRAAARMKRERPDEYARLMAAEDEAESPSGTGIAGRGPVEALGPAVVAPTGKARSKRSGKAKA